MSRIGTDNLSKSSSQRMARIGSKNTSPERVLRAALWRVGGRYRVHYAIEGVHVDVAFPGSRTAVFVDGCFWHGCPEHYRTPPSNQAFWRSKLLDNTRRDIRQTELLENSGWCVIRVWECEISADAEAIARLIVNYHRGSIQEWRRFRSVVMDATVISTKGNSLAAYAIEHFDGARSRGCDFRVVSEHASHVPQYATK